MAEEIALFIDFENIRYSLLNTQHREPDPQELINIARRYGTVMVAKAYADWSRQPEMFKGSLTAAMIDRVDCPAKQRDRYRSGWQPPTPGTGNGTGYNNNNNNTGWNGTRESAPDNSVNANWGTSNITLSTVDGEMIDEPNSSPRISDTQEISPALGQPSTGGPAQFGSQSTVDLNMLMDIIETVFDRPSISHFVLMTGDRDFTRICARLKLRLNKFVVVAGVPGTVSRDLTAAANQFVLLGNHSTYGPVVTHQQPQQQPSFVTPSSIDPSDPQFLQFLDYIDRHWAWRTIIGVSNFIGDPYNHKNRFRGRLSRESARDLLQTCIQQGILLHSTDMAGNEDLRLNRANPLVESTLAANAPQQSYGQQSHVGGAPMPMAPLGSNAGSYISSTPWGASPGSSSFAQTSTSSYVRRIAGMSEDTVEVEEIDGEMQEDFAEEDASDE